MKKQEKGITLIALIITIVVLMILAVVTINSVKDGGIITHAQNAANSYKEAQIEEEVGLYSMEYYMSNGRSMQEETISTMELVCKETGISPEKLTVHYNPGDDSEYVLYRIDKTTEEEKNTLENFEHEQLTQRGIKALRGDIDLDGVLTQNDVKLIEEYDSWGDIRYEATELQLGIADIDGNEEVDVSDSAMIECVIYGRQEIIYEGGYLE